MPRRFELHSPLSKHPAFLLTPVPFPEAYVDVPPESGAIFFLALIIMPTGNGTEPHNEIDIAIQPEAEPSFIAASFVGPNADAASFNATSTPAYTAAMFGGFHNYSFLWEPQALTWSIDGEPFFAVYGSEVPWRAMQLRLILRTATGLPGPPGTVYVKRRVVCRRIACLCTRRDVERLLRDILTLFRPVVHAAVDDGRTSASVSAAVFGAAACHRASAGA